MIRDKQNMWRAAYHNIHTTCQASTFHLYPINSRLISTFPIDERSEAMGILSKRVGGM